MLVKPDKLTKTQKIACVDRLFEESAPKMEFFLLLILSAGIVSLGLLLNNSPIVIGGMLIAPLLFPILTFSMGIVVSDIKLIKRSTMMIWWAMVSVIAISFAISVLTLGKELNPEIMSRAHANLAYFLIAMFSGVAVAYSLARPSVSEVLPGVAVTVALLPPLATIGIAISFCQWSVAVGALGLFALNLLGIIFAALVVFSVLNFYEVKQRLETKIKAEEKVAEKAKKEADKEKIVQIEKTVKEMAEIIKETKKDQP